MEGDEREKAKEILNMFEEEIKAFEHYTIPSKFFGLQSSTVDFYYGSTNVLENATDVDFIVKA